MSERDQTRLVIGCMTGTSIDGLDAALVRVRGRGLGMACEFVRGVTRELGGLATGLRAMADQKAMTAGEIARLSREFALLHASAIRELLSEERPALVAVHGQTVFHEPPVSWQMFNGAALAHEVGAPVVFDMRGANLAAGGQGAPITPLADWVFFRSAMPTAVINLGGFCNLTILPADHGEPGDRVREIDGFDVCACNQILDRIARRSLGRPYDEGGGAALEGVVHREALADLLGKLAHQSRAARSLGTGDEAGTWVDAWSGGVGGEDLAATACAAIGQTIAVRAKNIRRVLVAGGGARNVALLRAIGEAMGVGVEATDAAGVPIEFREAAGMAVLGTLCVDRVPITLPRVTGLRGPAPVSGVWAGIGFTS